MSSSHHLKRRRTASSHERDSYEDRNGHRNQDSFNGYHKRRRIRSRSHKRNERRKSYSHHHSPARRSSHHRNHYRHNHHRRHGSYERRREYTRSHSRGRHSVDHYKPQPKYDDDEGHYIFRLGEDLTARYKILRFMGEGTFARVVECWDRKEKKHVAIKIVRSIDKYTDAAEIEVDLLKDLKKKDPEDSHNVIQYVESFMFRGHMCIVFPKYGLSLYDFLKKNDYHGFSIQQVQQFSYRLLVAIDFLHDIKLVHTDLKPENILMVDSEYTWERGADGTQLMNPKHTDIRVIDFGSATYEHQHHTSIISTRHYRAPEVILGLGWSYPADIWSVGCIIVELLTGDAIFQTHENREHLAMMEKVLGPLPISMTKKCCKSAEKYFREDGTLNWPSIASNESSRSYVAKMKDLKFLCGATSQENTTNDKMYDLVRRLLAFNPEDRLTAKQALKHNFFEGMH